MPCAGIHTGRCSAGQAPGSVPVTDTERHSVLEKGGRLVGGASASGLQAALRGGRERGRLPVRTRVSPRNSCGQAAGTRDNAPSVPAPCQRMGHVALSGARATGAGGARRGRAVGALAGRVVTRVPWGRQGPTLRLSVCSGAMASPVTRSLRGGWDARASRRRLRFRGQAGRLQRAGGRAGETAGGRAGAGRL